MNKVLFYIKIAAGIAISCIGRLTGGFDMLLSCLATLVVIDYITGISAAVCTGTLSSRTGFNGIIKKLCIFIAVAVANCVGCVTGISGIRDITVSFYIANEGISILENLGRVGVPLPEKLKSVLIQLKKEAH